MIKQKILIFTGFAGLIFLSGCVSVVKKQNDLEVQGLKNQVVALHQQIQYKDEEINGLKNSSNTGNAGDSLNFSGTSQKHVIKEVKSRPNARQIQICLKNAGYNPGTVDGKIGKQTRDAVKAFQKANNLKADGKVGKQTWKLLSKHLE